ncbi:hypothetical protein MB27_24925 [Actinoplanes utahensis]|uniref:Uncharacterized protein n=1 Tax=Actinoplanes utahensis TaxID=1869 RepID=A0A0A6UHU9_ACTUT|nr:hypothetical protein MB27_24925 [Actinoplanes utahensis]
MAGLGARLAATGGPDLRDFGAVPAGPGEPVTEVGRAGRTRWRNRTTVIVASAVTVALLGCLGAAVFSLIETGGPPESRPASRVSPVPSAAGPVVAGPQPVKQPVRTENDLDRVCADRYYPSAPKPRGDAPHPVLISEGTAGAESRTTRTLNRAAFAGSAADRRTWAPEPARTQLVACLNLAGAGKRIRDCKSGGRTLPLLEGRYTLTVHEVASHRKVLEKALVGAERACPFVVLESDGGTLHSAVRDQQLYDLLRKPVEG